MATATTREQRMFGVTVAEVDTEIAKADSPKSFAMSVLSDAQEEMALGGAEHIERARQLINCAKYAISK